MGNPAGGPAELMAATIGTGHQSQYFTLVGRGGRGWGGIIDHDRSERGKGLTEKMTDSILIQEEKRDRRFDRK